jgi:hypothetical protein
MRIPDVLELAIESPRPNPSSGELRLAFTTPRAGGVRVGVVDIAGRTVWSRDMGLLQSGRHEIEVLRSGTLSPGIYHVVLSYEGRRVERRWAVTR